MAKLTPELIKRLGAFFKEAPKGGLLRYGEEAGPATYQKIWADDPLVSMRTEKTPKGIPQTIIFSGSHEAPLNAHSKAGLLNAQKNRLAATDDAVMRWALTQPDSAKFVSMDASSLPSKSGLAKEFYPFIGEKFAANPDVFLTPEASLTWFNQPRRSINTVGTTLRHPERSVFVPHSDQLSGSGLGISDFLALPNYEQAGVLAYQGDRLSRRNMFADLNRKLGSEVDKFGEVLSGLDDKLAKFEIDPVKGDLGVLGNPSATDDARAEAIGYLQKLGGIQVGPEMARRARLMEAVSEGRDVPPELFQNLFFKRGGLVSYADSRRR